MRVNRQIVGFKKIKFYTMENVGAGKLSMPEQEMHTTAFWLHFPAAFLARSDRTRLRRRKQSGIAGTGQRAAHGGRAALLCAIRATSGWALGEGRPGRPRRWRWGRRIRLPLGACLSESIPLRHYPGGVAEAAPRSTAVGVAAICLQQTGELLAGGACEKSGLPFVRRARRARLASGEEAVMRILREAMGRGTQRTCLTVESLYT